MSKQRVINQAIELLKSVKVDELEDVQINVCDYNDGSEGITIDLTYPTK